MTEQGVTALLERAEADTDLRDALLASSTSAEFEGVAKAAGLDLCVETARLGRVDLDLMADARETSRTRGAASPCVRTC